MNLDQYYISFADHMVDVATEGFFIDDKNPKTKSIDEFGTGVWEVINYKNLNFRVIGPKWAEVFVNTHSKTTVSFKKNGLKAIQSFINELSKAEQFVKANGDKFREAQRVKNDEVLNNLASGLRNCFPTLRSYIEAAKRGNTQFSGDMIDMDDVLKSKLITLLNQYQKIYREIGTFCIKTYINEHHAKSTIKKIFRHTNLDYAKNYYLEEELFAYCRDVHIIIQNGLYS